MIVWSTDAVADRVLCEKVGAFERNPMGAFPKGGGISPPSPGFPSKSLPCNLVDFVQLFM